MSNRRNSTNRRQAHLFAALGDQTRLSLVSKLSDGRPRSITQLSEDHNLTRQAITKHLHVLADVGIVKCIRSGRESLYEFDAKPLNDLQTYLESVSQQWDDALARLKRFVED